MVSWMKQLALHYDETRRNHPQDTLMILFDIDGTILDMRFLILHVLRKFDEVHGTGFFEGLEFEDITVHENHVDDLLEQLHVPVEERRRILDFWFDTRWQPSSLMESHRPFMGVMEIIRWFQMQPNVVVALNTGRPEHLRADTLRSLNALGEEYSVCFASEYLHMNQRDWEDGVANSKAEGIRRFQNAGYRVFAMIDNEPSNLAAVYELDECRDILPLHADTLFEGKCGDLPYCSASGSDYVLSDVATEDTLPQDVQFVWHGVNDRVNLRQFIGSDVEWGEIDVRTDPETGTLIPHHDSLNNHPTVGPDEHIDLEEALHRLNRFEKSIKLDFKEGDYAVEQVLKILADEGVQESRLWFNGNIEVLEEQGFKRLREAYPRAIIQCPIDSLASECLDSDGDARDKLNSLRSWGVTRFSIEWDTPELARIIHALNEWGFETNIYNVPDLDSFLHAVLLGPCSVTADFNFPRWHYYGRGSGEHGEYHNYSMEDSASNTNSD